MAQERFADQQPSMLVFAVPSQETDLFRASCHNERLPRLRDPIARYSPAHPLRANRRYRFDEIRQKESTLTKYAPLFLIAFAFICSGCSFTQSVDKEGAAVLELGVAAGRSLTEGQSNFGPTVAVEVTPIENWLELEAGVTPLFRRHSTEWTVDLLFKKPWTLSEKTEFMLGIGPEWIHSNGYGIKLNSVAAEIAPDFMFWSSKKHKFGWYLEPSYEYKFGPGHEHSLGISGGLLISIP